MESGNYINAKFDGIGGVWIAATREGVCRIEFGNCRSQFVSRLPSGIDWIEGKDELKRVIDELRRFAADKKTTFSLKLDIRSGTQFQKRVWKKIATIPWGETRSYAWLAKAIGKPRAFRAVANACGANPLPMIIPCHRVIASDGTIGGFSSGTKLKRRLLILESRGVP